MECVLYIFVIGLLNFGLGYCLAFWTGAARPRPRWQPPIVEAIHMPAPEQAVWDADPIVEPPPEETSEETAEPAAEEPEPPEELDLETLIDSIATRSTRLRKLAAKLHKGRVDDFQTTGWRFVAELQEICTPYLRQLERLTESGTEVGALNDEIEGLTLVLFAQLETTLGNLQHMDFNGDLAGVKSRLLGEIERLLSGGDDLRAALEALAEAEPVEEAAA